MNKQLNQEKLLTLWIMEKPTAKSPYGLYGYPPMWKTLTCGEVTLFSRPGRTMKSLAFYGYKEVDGVHWQWARTRDGTWLAQGSQGTFDDFEKYEQGVPAQAEQWLADLSFREAWTIANLESSKLVKGSAKYIKPRLATDQTFEGRIIGITDRHVVQKIGPKYLIHELEMLKAPPVIGDKMSISYEPEQLDSDPGPGM